MFHDSLWVPIQREARHKLKDMRHFLLPFSVLFSSLGSGCTNHSIRDGIWELSFQAHIIQNQQSFEIPTREVKVVLGWGQETGEGEIAEISVVEPASPASPEGGSPGENGGEDHPPELALKPMYADILVKHEGDPPSVQIEHQDGYWVWRMHGFVKSPTLIAGSNFNALYKHGDNKASLNGRWIMRWLRDQ